MNSSRHTRDQTPGRIFADAPAHEPATGEWAGVRPPPCAPVRILILGGTSEAWELSALLTDRPDVVAITSLAGRVSQPRLPKGLTRVGGFGGVDGLISYLKLEHIAVVIDATHPFAVRISGNVEIACSRLGLRLIRLGRPPWTRTEDDLWHEVPNFKTAALLVDRPGSRVFLSLGRQELPVFADCTRATYLIRAIEKPLAPLPPHHNLILERGPFDLGHEIRLLWEHSIDVLVSKNSGGSATYSKIEAARMLAIPAVIIARPAENTERTFPSFHDVCVELDSVLAGHPHAWTPRKEISS